MIRICMVGLGSIGSRHAKNLFQVLTSRGIPFRLDALRATDRPLPENIKQLINAEYAAAQELPCDYDIIFITNPTSEHINTLSALRSKTVHFFIEKPIVVIPVSPKLLQAPQGSVYYTAAPLRYHPAIQYVKRVVASLRVFSVRCMCSTNLRIWRDRDYRNIYSASKALGGGVDLDMIHEWDYITHIFGFPQEIKKIGGQYSDLEIDSVDVAVYIAKYTSFLAEVHLDYFGLSSQRYLEILHSEGRIVLDIIQNTVTEYSKDGKENRQVFDGQDIYIKELNAFFDMVFKGDENTNPPERALNVLKLAKITNMELENDEPI